MGRCILLLVAIGMSLGSRAQGTLERASVQVDLSKEAIQLTQTLHLDLPDTTKHVDLRALRLDHLSLSGFTIQSDRYNVEAQDPASSKLYRYKILATDDEQLDDLTISYTWHRSTEKAEIPLFFPDMPAASSNDTLFAGEIQLTEELVFRMDFPKVDYDQKVENGRRTINFSLPALPSLLRIQYGDEGNLSTNIGLVADWCIAAVFMIMAIIIWLNRKRLTYG